ncbi:MAG: amylo-alpha-1,6-glucosidase [Burkholderiales bacterium]
MVAPLPDPIRFGREVCGDLAAAERREWWLANGRGAFAAGTVAGTLTRCYHGLLIAPVHPPLGRQLIVAKADATLTDGARSWPLFTNRWGSGDIAPRGHLHLESFALDGRIPTWIYACDELRIEHRVWMEYGEDTTHVAWRLAGGTPPQPLRLVVKLLVNARDFHGTSRPWGFDPALDAQGPRLRVVHGDEFALTLQASNGTIAPRHDWYEDFDLPVERERGLPDRDSHLCVGEAEIALDGDAWCGIVASLRPEPSANPETSLRRAQTRERSVLGTARRRVPELATAPDWVQRLVLAADSFVFARPLPDAPDGESVIAGYPWFGDWGRDTMIALPGLALATGRCETARRVLQTFARFVDRGMLPNVFPGAGDVPEYNTVDAALWYVEAWRAYVETTRDLDALAQAYPVLASIIDWHVQGTRYGIGVDPADGLLRAGEPGVQVTWMDARIGGQVFTPRIGKAVEVNALWHNALVAMTHFASLLGADPSPCRALAERARASFSRFVNPAGGLHDVIDGPDGVDATVRPNQIFAVSLPASPIAAEVQRSVVDVCGRFLATSYGLRSLDPRHPDYRPHYTGGVWERDSGYHQGPVWAWLLGHYALASHRVSGNAAAAQALLEPLRDHLADAGLGSVSEIFDGAPPHAPRGAPCQAWSVACTLEAWWRLERAKRTAAAGASNDDQLIPPSMIAARETP